MAKFDPKAKAKRQKIIAGVLGLVLVGVLVFQAPTILGAFGGSSTPPAEQASATPAPAPAPVPTPVTPGVPAAAPTPVPAGGSAALVDSDPAPVPADGQLVSFDRFESKDPFVQQVSDTAAPSAPAPVAADPGSKAENPDGGTTIEPAPPPAPAPVARTATISVNGEEHRVGVGGSFPETDPIFKLVSLKGSTARIGIVGGSYANGVPTITLRRGGKPVTLMNTADGTTYVLRLTAVG
jgi:hypothetical protein